MNIIEYLKENKDISFKEKPFNECDALVFSTISYFPFHKIEQKPVYNAKTLYNFLSSYNANDEIVRKKNHLTLLKEACLAKRYKNISFTNFLRVRDDDTFKQFQAITIHFNNFMFISFCGTDSSVTGWREDLNMSHMQIVPSEVEAINYVRKVTKYHPFKTIYLGGHSKGGRLAIRGAKEVTRINRLAGVYSFDGPGFQDDFYDEKYEAIKSKINIFLPSESIIGRLFSPRNDYYIVSSTKKLLNQHDAYSWVIENDQFVREDVFSVRSTIIVDAINDVIKKYDDETKYKFVEALFSLFEKAGITELTFFEKEGISKRALLFAMIDDLRDVPKDIRSVLMEVLFRIFKDILKNSLKDFRKLI